MTTPGPESISLRSVAEHTSAEVAAAVTRSFEGYLVPIRMTAQGYERRFRGEDLDPFASRVLSDTDGALIGVVLVARRGWTSRIAAMGLAPEARGQGLGRWLLDRAAAEARARGDRAVLLEVIEQNTPAVRLYESAGFRSLRRLVGYRKESSEEAPETGETLTEIDPLDFARMVACEGEDHLPWMLAAETLSAATSPLRAVSLAGCAFALINDPAAETLGLISIIVPRAERDKGYGTRLMRALEASYPGKPWVVSAIVPEDLAPGFFAKVGWGRQKLSQLEMRLELGERT
jgi:ribosomal protein S18 acetylase RimI-like enzyme